MALLRLRIDGHTVFCEIRPQGQNWRVVETVDFGDPVGDPVAVRIGKPGRKAEGLDYDVPGELVRLKVKHFAAYSRVKPAALNALQESLDMLKNISVFVNYELYDGIPVMSKWIELANHSFQPVMVNNISSELLGLADHDPYNEYAGRRDLVVRPNVHMETESPVCTLKYIRLPAWLHQSQRRNLEHPVSILHPLILGCH